MTMRALNSKKLRTLSAITVFALTVGCSIIEPKPEAGELWGAGSATTWQEDNRSAESVARSLPAAPPKLPRP